MDPRRGLADFVPRERTRDGDLILEQFLAWVATTGLELYPAQEEAILELMAGRNVVLATPTGSGKSLVATALHFKAMCERLRCFYTSPIKALVNEKFFELCDQLGAANVGMLTGDASINSKANIICCTAEVLANLALRDGQMAEVDYIVMDEFHFYSDPDRGIAWQVPLITVPHARFLLMSATLGDMSLFEQRLADYTGTGVTVVRSEERPVPLEWEWRETPLHETIFDLTTRERAPIYVVSFTQRECAERAQDLLSVNLCTKEEKEALAAATAGTRFDSVYGPEIKKLIRHGIGIHHAGILPKYRTLVERLAQKGLLKIISGTDTLGVGVNVPIRSVLFTKLCKFDGTKTRILSVRDFKQIAGRAGRKGFDTRGWVLAQAPEHVIENLRMEAKAGGKKKFVRKQPPAKGYVPWDNATFEKLQKGEPEPLQSRFEITHGMLLTVLRREVDPMHRDGGYRRVVDLVANSYERPGMRSRHRKAAAQMLRELRGAGVVELVPDVRKGRPALRVSDVLQADFSLHHTLSLYLLDALTQLDPASETHALDVLSMVEAILESPQAVLFKQIDKLKGDLVAQLKAEGVEYDDRMAQLEKVDHPKPLAELIYATYDDFRTRHPWVARDNVKPKSIARDMYEKSLGFGGYVKEYGLQRSEGVLLRYLTQVYKALVQNVPDGMKDEALFDLETWLFAMLSRVDNTLLLEWERMLLVARGELDTEALRTDEVATVTSTDPAADPRRFVARVRAELHALVAAIAKGDADDVLAIVRSESDDPWTIERLEAAVKPFFEEHPELDATPRARQPHLTDIAELEPRRWKVRHVLMDAEGETSWFIDAEIDLRDVAAWEGPLLRLRGLST